MEYTTSSVRVQYTTKSVGITTLRANYSRVIRGKFAPIGPRSGLFTKFEFANVQKIATIGPKE